MPIPDALLSGVGSSDLPWAVRETESGEPVSGEEVLEKVKARYPFILKRTKLDEGDRSRYLYPSKVIIPVSPMIRRSYRELSRHWLRRLIALSFLFQGPERRTLGGMYI